jgi:hypothetical protein
MAYIRVYRTYNFIDKDPIIDRLRTVLQDEGLEKKRHIVSRLSGVAPATLANWFEGATKRPQHATLAAVATSVGYEFGFDKSHVIDVDQELEHAAQWMKQQKANRKRAEARKKSKKKNGK